MKDRREVPMKGDRAYVMPSLYGYNDGCAHLIVEVLGDPFVDDTYRPMHNPTPRPTLANRVAGLPPRFAHGVIATRRLIRIPPDEESKRLFAETENPDDIDIALSHVRTRRLGSIG